MPTFEVVVRGTKVAYTIHDMCIEGSIYYMKVLIEQWCGLAVDRLALYDGADELSDDFQFKNHPEVKGRTEKELETFVLGLDLQVTPLACDQEFNITLKSGSRSKQIMVRESESVPDLKRKVLSAFDISPPDIILSRFDMEMRDNCYLWDYYVCPDCEVQFSLVVKSLKTVGQDDNATYLG